jgi:hypothetical protein
MPFMYYALVRQCSVVPPVWDDKAEEEYASHVLQLGSFLQSKAIRPYTQVF